MRRLLLRKGRPLDMRIEGDLGPATAGLAPAGRAGPRPRALPPSRACVPTRRPFFALSAREGDAARRLPALDAARAAGREHLRARRSCPPTDFASWPTGAAPASVCVGDKTYVVTLRPLLPGETP